MRVNVSLNINGNEMSTSLSDCGDLPCYVVKWSFSDSERDSDSEGAPLTTVLQKCLKPHWELDLERAGFKVKDLLKGMN